MHSVTPDVIRATIQGVAGLSVPEIGTALANDPELSGLATAMIAAPAPADAERTRCELIARLNAASGNRLTPRSFPRAPMTVK